MNLQATMFISLLGFATFSGCTTPDAAMKSFIGVRSSELVAQWGPPQHTMPDGRGGEIWTYFNQRQWTTPGQATTTFNAPPVVYPNPYAPPMNVTATTTINPPQTQGYTARRTFFIDSNGIIYRYSWKGI